MLCAQSLARGCGAVPAAVFFVLATYGALLLSRSTSFLLDARSFDPNCESWGMRFNSPKSLSSRIALKLGGAFEGDEVKYPEQFRARVSTLWASASTSKWAKVPIGAGQGRG